MILFQKGQKSHSSYEKRVGGYNISITLSKEKFLSGKVSQGVLIIAVFDPTFYPWDRKRSSVMILELRQYKNDSTEPKNG